MKNFKSLISIILTAVMLFTAVPSAFASDVTDAPSDIDTVGSLIWFAEPFAETGVTTMSRRGVSTANNASNYNTVATFNYEPRDGNTTDYALNLSVSVNDTSKSNYAGVRKEVSTSEYFPLTKSVFSLSYDVCFKTVPASGTILAIAGRNIKADGTDTWGIARNVFAGVSDNTQHVGISGTQQKIKVNEWYSVKHIFDTRSGKEYMSYADSAGNVTNIEPQTINNYPSAMSNIKGVFMIDISARQACEYYMDNVTLENIDVAFAADSMSFDLSQDISADVYIPWDHISANIVIDGQTVGHISPVSGKSVYTITIPAGTLSAGSHTLGVTGGNSYSDDYCQIKVAQVAIRGLTDKNGDDMSTDVETFDSLKYSTGAAVNDEVGLTEVKYDAIFQNTIWMSDNKAFLVPGPSGDDDDYGLQIRTNNRLIQVKNTLSTTNPPDNGKLVLDMDILCNSDATTVEMSKMGMTGFMSANKLFGQIEVEAGKWTHVNMVFDFDTSTWTLKANGREATKAVTIGSETFTQIRFTLKSDNATFAIDNARIYNIRYYSGVESMEYVVGSDAYPISGAVPADADAVKLITGEGIDDSTIDCITVTDTSGKAVELASLTYSASDKSITITPKTKFPEARGIIVDFGKGTKFADGTPVAQPYSVAFDVESASITTDASFYVNGSNLNDDTSLGMNDVVSVVISAENISASQSTCTYVLSLRKLTTIGGEQISQLVSLKAKDVSLKAKDVLLEASDTFELELDAITEPGDYEVYLMIIDSFANSKSKAEYIKIN